MQQINDQIQQRLEEKQLQEEMKEQERQQTRKNQERMNLEDLQVSNQKPQPSTTWVTEWISEDLFPALLTGPAETKGGAAAPPGGGLANQC